MRGRAVVLVLAVFVAAAMLRARDGSPAVRERAIAFLQTLTPALSERALAPFVSKDRERWTYVPLRREGVTLGELEEEQRVAWRALLEAALSREGLRKARGVLTLEAVLVELGADPRFRDPGRYYLRLYGDPGKPGPWGFRLEGHHLSLHYTSIGGTVVSGTPAFFGANPHTVPRGKHQGMRILGREEDLGREVLAALDGEPRKRAILEGRTPREIVTGASARARLAAFEGCPYPDLGESGRAKLRELVELYARNHRPAVADAFLKRVADAGWDQVHFAWAGGTDAGLPHYYRVHGPTFVIEYVNAQDGANHSHTVLREFGNDFGRDALKDHLEREHRDGPGK